MSICTTKKYEMFQLLNFNRDVRKTRKLEESMKKHGFIHAYPLHVVKDGDKLMIKGGHHRFTVAVKLGLPVAYVVCQDKASIHELEGATVQWSLTDYMTSFVRLGYPDYMQVQRYCELTKIGVGQAASMLAGELASNNNYNETFKAGKYKVKRTDYAEMVAEIVIAIKSYGIEWAHDRLVVNSLSRIISGGHANVARLKNKIKLNTSLVKKQPSLQGYMELWEKIYNRREQHDKIPLAFLTNETIAKRQICLKHEELQDK